MTWLTNDVTMTSSWIKRCDFTMIIENTTEFVFVRKLYILYVIYIFYFKTIAHFSVTWKKQSRTFLLNSIDNIMNSIYKRIAMIAKRRKELLRYCIYFTNNFPWHVSIKWKLTKHQLYSSTNNKISRQRPLTHINQHVTTCYHSCYHSCYHFLTVHFYINWTCYHMLPSIL